MSSSAAKIEANRANAQLSTGPKSVAGRAKSSMNAVKTGLTGRTVLLTTDDTAAYQELVKRFQNRYQPATDEERELTQQLADTEWRLLRISTLETGIYAIGRRELASQFEKEDPEIAASMLEAQIFLLYQRPLNNLSIQENRLRRSFHKTEAKLMELQKPRKDLAARQLGEATNVFLERRKSGEPFDWKALGFDFSDDALFERAATLLARKEQAAHPLIRTKQILHELREEKRTAA